MAAQSLFGFVLLLLLTLQLKTATSEPQFSDTNGFVKLPTELQQKAYKYSQGYQGDSLTMFEHQINSKMHLLQKGPFK